MGVDDNARISRSRRASSVRRLLFRSLFGPFCDGFCFLNSEPVRDSGRCGGMSCPARSGSICDERWSREDSGRCEDARADSEPSPLREARLFWRLEGRREGLRPNVGSATGGSCSRDDWRVVASSALTWMVWRLFLRPKGHIAMAPGGKLGAPGRVSGRYRERGLWWCAIGRLDSSRSERGERGLGDHEDVKK